MPNVLQKCKIVIYGDDTFIFNISQTDEECQVNFDLNNVNKWLKMNKLTINEDKTKIMEINMNNNSDMEVNNKIIEKPEKIKCLGFIIDNGVNFKDLIDYISKKLQNKINFFGRKRKKILTLTVIKIYNSIIKAHFEFGSTILYTCCTSGQIEKLKKRSFPKTLHKERNSYRRACTILKRFVSCDLDSYSVKEQKMLAQHTDAVL